MSDARYRECCRILHWHWTDVADVTGIDARVIRRWWAGTAPIPAPVLTWLEALAGFHTAHPPPTLEQVREAVHAQRQSA